MILKDPENGKLSLEYELLCFEQMDQWYGKKEGMFRLSKENHMDPGEQSLELANVTYVEERIISRVICFSS